MSLPTKVRNPPPRHRQSIPVSSPIHPRSTANSSAHAGHGFLHRASAGKPQITQISADLGACCRTRSTQNVSHEATKPRRRRVLFAPQKEPFACFMTYVRGISEHQMWILRRMAFSSGMVLSRAELGRLQSSLFEQQKEGFAFVASWLRARQYLRRLRGAASLSSLSGTPRRLEISKLRNFDASSFRNTVIPKYRNTETAMLGKRRLWRLVTA